MMSARWVYARTAPAFALLLTASLLPAAPSAEPRTGPCLVDRSLHPGSKPYSDADLCRFLNTYGATLPRGAALPLWLDRWLIATAGEPLAVAGPPEDLAGLGGPNVPLTTSSKQEDEAWVAIDRARPDRLIAAANVYGTGQALFASRDGGATWTETPMPRRGGERLQGDPGVTWDASGAGYASTLGIFSATVRAGS